VVKQPVRIVDEKGEEKEVEDIPKFWIKQWGKWMLLVEMGNEKSNFEG
jgi:hypothetical protein